MTPDMRKALWAILTAAAIGAGSAGLVMWKDQAILVHEIAVLRGDVTRLETGISNLERGIRRLDRREADAALYRYAERRAPVLDAPALPPPAGRD